MTKITKKLPSLSDTEVWDLFGERGVFSCDAHTFKSCFDVFEHKEGMFCYRLKPRSEIDKIQPIDTGVGLFDGVALSDTMLTLVAREEGGDKIYYMRTHYHAVKTVDCLETEFGVSESDYTSEQAKLLTDKNKTGL